MTITAGTPRRRAAHATAWAWLPLEYATRPAGAHGGRDPERRVVGAANLEGADRLKILRLQPQRAAGLHQLPRPLAGQQRRAHARRPPGGPQPVGPPPGSPGQVRSRPRFPAWTASYPHVLSRVVHGKSPPKLGWQLRRSPRKGCMKVLLFLVVMALVVWALFEILQTDSREIRRLSKPLWILIVVLLTLPGALAWFFLGRPKVPVGTPGQRGPAEFRPPGACVRPTVATSPARRPTTTRSSCTGSACRPNTRRCCAAWSRTSTRPSRASPPPTTADPPEDGSRPKD